MKPVGDQPSENQVCQNLKWKVLRATVCRLYFRDRSEDHCASCEDRVRCFQMIKETLDLSKYLRTKNETNERQDRCVLTHQGCA